MIESKAKAAALGRFRSNKAVIGIIGLGYVGQPLALCFAEGGSRVLGFDINEHVVQLLNSGRSNIEHISDERIAACRRNGFEATSDYSRIGEADCLIICVPTPLNRNREPDMSYI